jgi:SAM-dependent methyltransferase
MTPTTLERAPSGEPALAAYEPLAPYYDLFTEGAQYEAVLAQIEGWACAHGLRGRRLLDVACGTGKSFEPLLEKGYEVSACDLSPAMVAEARRRAAPGAEVVVADMRDLPWRGRFDLVTCLDDAVNYLLTEEDLDAAMASMAATLAPGGILVFDTNALAAYRTEFAEEFELVARDTRFRWRGGASRDVRPGAVVTMTLTVETADATCESRHVQRHWPVERLRRACEVAGFEQVVFRGLAEGPRLVGEPNEELHPKVVCLARGLSSETTRPPSTREKGIS